MRERLTGGEISLRKAYLCGIIERIDVDDELIKKSGRKDVLEQAIMANGGPTPGVRDFVRSWRTRQESNL
jgi:site-specific DNA recombinase